MRKAWAALLVLVLCLGLAAGYAGNRRARHFDTNPARQDFANGDVFGQPASPADLAAPADATAEPGSHEALANAPNRSLMDMGLTPERTEQVLARLAGPRIGIAGLNAALTYDFGVVPADRPTRHDFAITNVGDEDLVLTRVYAGCACMTLTMNALQVDERGFLKPPRVLRPNDAAVLSVRYDPRAETGRKPGARAKFVQVFSNDPTKTRFDANDPGTAEARFRIVVQPRALNGMDER